jgi:hypothetical protein
MDRNDLAHNKIKEVLLQQCKGSRILVHFVPYILDLDHLSI